jgi:putative 4-mercaptohistidine N1-methyltranferase
MPTAQGGAASDAGRSFHFTLITSPATQYRHAKNIAIFLAGAATALVYTAYIRRKALRKLFQQPNLADAASGAEILETRAAVDRLLLTTLGRPQDVLPELFLKNNTPPDLQNHFTLALDYPKQLALLCERHCTALCDFTGEYGEATALDIGCGLGATTFELSRAFQHVIGVDSTKSYISAARLLKQRGYMRYTSTVEGELTKEYSSVVDEDIETDRVNFALIEDLSSIPRELAGPHDAVLASNVLCRVQDPMKFITQLEKVVRPGGVLVLSSLFDWQESCTARNHWLGGYKERDGEGVYSVDRLKAAMKELHFELIVEEDVPLLLSKVHDRRYEVGVGHVSVWRKK